MTDDHPVQEYGVLSLLEQGNAVPASVVNLTEVAAWCPACFMNGKPVPLVEGLDTYLALLDRAYAASPEDVAHARRLSRNEGVSSRAAPTLARWFRSRRTCMTSLGSTCLQGRC